MPDKNIRIDLEIYDQVAEVAKASHRSPRQQIEYYCQQGLEREQAQLEAIRRNLRSR